MNDGMKKGTKDGVKSGAKHPAARGSSRPRLTLVRDAPPDAPVAALPTRAQEPAERAGGPSGRGGTSARPPSDVAELRAELRERTADLQRLKAEYDNYRKRIRRDRLAIRQIAVANVLDQLLPVLDALTQATEQGEVTGGFQRVARVFETQLAELGLQSLGAVGDTFDPRIHEALRYTPDDQAERPVCTAILRPGYRVGDHLLRPAQVTVTEAPAAASRPPPRLHPL